MDFFFFNLMPYGALDLNYDKEFSSANLVLPNSYYDPEEGHKLYTRYLDELEYADELGFDGVCVNEHHQTAYGLMPTPGVIAGALARNTKNAKVCILGRALPLVNNPLMIAEEFAMIDNITKGRFVAGFVRGLGVEYHAMGINPAFSLERFHEAHDLVIRAKSNAILDDHVGGDDIVTPHFYVLSDYRCFVDVFHGGHFITLDSAFPKPFFGGNIEAFRLI